MLSNASVVAVVVTYNGGPPILHGISELLKQGVGVCIVDNGSDGETLAAIDSVSDQCRKIIKLGTNLGIAAALNCGVDYARANAYEWVLTMDQDSVPLPGMIGALLAAVERYPDAASFAPRLRSGTTETARTGSIGFPVAYAISSGNLVRTRVYDVVGTYSERLFIDCVDFDFCLRIRKAGMRIVRVDDAVLIHCLGDGKSTHNLGRWYTAHSNVRRYYMFRNMWFIIEKHGLKFPLFTIKFVASHILLLASIWMVERNARDSSRAVVCGTVHYFGGKMGRLSSELESVLVSGDNQNEI